jgi:hypothetical protein
MTATAMLVMVVVVAGVLLAGIIVMSRSRCRVTGNTKAKQGAGLRLDQSNRMNPQTGALTG